MYIGGNYCHPTFLYESLWCIFGFIMLIIIRKNKNIKLGTLSSFYLIWYGIGRFMIEGMRTDSLMFGFIRMAQLVSALMIIIGISMYIISNYKIKKLYNEVK